MPWVCRIFRTPRHTGGSSVQHGGVIFLVGTVPAEVKASVLGVGHTGVRPVRIAASSVRAGMIDRSSYWKDRLLREKLAAVGTAKMARQCGDLT